MRRRRDLRKARDRQTGQSDTAPAIVMMIARTVEKIGRSMKKSISALRRPPWLCGRGSCRQWACALTGVPGFEALHAVDDHDVARP